MRCFIRENRDLGSSKPGFQKDGNNQKKDQGPRVNEQIRVPECRLIREDGEMVGVVSMSEARKLAEEEGVDLVEVSPTAKPPVVKLIDYGKYKYELQKKAHEAKKKQVVVQLKEVQVKPNIDEHDLQTKLKHCQKFLDQNDKIKLSMQFRGREMNYKEKGMEKFNSIVQTIIEMGAAVEAEPKLMGNRVIAILMPVKKGEKVKP